MCNIGFCRDYSIDDFGKPITPTKLPSDLSRKYVIIGKMGIGDHVYAGADALLMDGNGACWLNPNYAVTPYEKSTSNLYVARTKLGYVVRVNYHYKQVNGYSIPIWDTWKPTGVPSTYIPVKTLLTIKPHYEEASPSRKKSLNLQKDYEPNFKRPIVPPNPYSMEKMKNVRSRVTQPDASPTIPKSNGGAESILPELFDGSIN